MALRILSLDQLKAQLQNIPNEAKRKIKQAIQTSALLVERDAKINAPVDTVTLRNSITHTLANEENGLVLSAKVGAQVFYGDFQEFGTGQRGAASGVITPSDYEYGSSRGIPAQPFLAPALLSNRARIQRLIGNAIADAIRSR